MIIITCISNKSCIIEMFVQEMENINDYYYYYDCCYHYREERLGAKQVVRVHNSDLTITSLKDSNTHRFQYDHCFWSFDGVQASFADQRTVYNEIARPLLDKAFEGYNTCLFAYGQVRPLIINLCALMYMYCQ